MCHIAKDGERGTNHDRGEIQAGPRPAEYHIAGNLQKKISDEENGESERIIR